MPEHPEVRAFAERITFEAEHTLFCDIQTSKACIYKNLPSLLLENASGANFTIKCKSRGKQIRIDLVPVPHQLSSDFRSIFLRLERVTSDVSETPYESYSKDNLVTLINTENLISFTLPASIVVGFGLAGYVNTFLTIEEALKDNAHLIFKASDAVLAICSSRPETMYWYVGNFDFARSPDPVTDYLEYVSNLVSKIYYVPLGLDGSPIASIKSIFSQPICHLLLMQSLFNGIGNYLRAEIMHRLSIHPFIPSIYVFEDLIRWLHSTIKQSKKDSYEKCDHNWMVFVKEHISVVETKCPLIPTVKRLCEEAYGVLGDGKLFSKWLLCYKKATNCVLDSNGREVWFFDQTTSIRVFSGKDNCIEKRCNSTNILASAEPSIKRAIIEQTTDLNARNVILNSTTDDIGESQVDVLTYSKKDFIRTEATVNNLPLNMRNESVNRGKDKLIQQNTDRRLQDARHFQNNFH